MGSHGRKRRILKRVSGRKEASRIQDVGTKRKKSQSNLGRPLLETEKRRRKASEHQR